MTTDTLRERAEEQQIKVLGKASQDLIKIVGRHSTLWNYSKLETVEKLISLISDLQKKERERIYKDLLVSLPESMRRVDKKMKIRDLGEFIMCASGHIAGVMEAPNFPSLTKEQE